MTDNDLFAKFPQLETERLILKEYLPDFKEDVYKLLSDPEVLRHETREPFTELAQAERYISYRTFVTRKKSEGIIWAMFLKDQDELIGDIGYNHRSEYNTAIGYKLRPDHWNRGLMTEAIRGVVNFLYAETETIRIEAATRVDNLASVKVLVNNGFQKEGVLRSIEHFKGQSFDMILYSLLRGEYAAQEA